MYHVGGYEGAHNPQHTVYELNETAPTGWTVKWVSYNLEMREKNIFAVLNSSRPTVSTCRHEQAKYGHLLHIKDYESMTYEFIFYKKKMSNST